MIEPWRRQPVHVVYGGAHLFKANTCTKLGELARKSLAEYAPDAHVLGAALGLSPELAAPVYARVSEKLTREAVEDFRIDFEDGFGVRSDEEEDAAARASAVEFSRAKDLPELSGIRVKAITPELGDRALRTLRIFLENCGPLPQRFVVTLPKISEAAQVASLAG
ncbi:MAG: phosphoenolpyruvate kinase, partial [Acidobacteriota bacterium]